MYATKQIPEYIFSENYISDRLKCDKEIVLEALKADESGEIIKYLCDDLKDDEDIVNLTVSKDKKNILYASKRFQKEAGVVEVRIERTVTETTTTPYETVVMVPIDVYSDNFDKSEYFDESKAEIVSEEEDGDEDEEYNSYIVW